MKNCSVREEIISLGVLLKAEGEVWVITGDDSSNRKGVKEVGMDVFTVAVIRGILWKLVVLTLGEWGEGGGGEEVLVQLMFCDQIVSMSDLWNARPTVLTIYFMLELCFCQHLWTQWTKLLPEWLFPVWTLARPHHGGKYYFFVNICRQVVWIALSITI